MQNSANLSSGYQSMYIIEVDENIIIQGDVQQEKLL